MFVLAFGFWGEDFLNGTGKTPQANKKAHKKKNTQTPVKTNAVISPKNDGKSTLKSAPKSDEESVAIRQGKSTDFPSFFKFLWTGQRLKRKTRLQSAVKRKLENKLHS